MVKVYGNNGSPKNGTVLHAKISNVIKMTNSRQSDYQMEKVLKRKVTTNPVVQYVLRARPNSRKRLFGSSATPASFVVICQRYLKERSKQKHTIICKNISLV